MTCKYCYGKGYSTTIYGAHGNPDFVGDKGFTEEPAVHYSFCTHCQRGKDTKRMVEYFLAMHGVEPEWKKREEAKMKFDALSQAEKDAKTAKDLNSVIRKSRDRIVKRKLKRIDGIDMPKVPKKRPAFLMDDELMQAAKAAGDVIRREQMTEHELLEERVAALEKKIGELEGSARE